SGLSNLPSLIMAIFTCSGPSRTSSTLMNCSPAYFLISTSRLLVSRPPPRLVVVKCCSAHQRAPLMPHAFFGSRASVFTCRTFRRVQLRVSPRIKRGGRVQRVVPEKLIGRAAADRRVFLQRVFRGRQAAVSQVLRSFRPSEEIFRHPHFLSRHLA